MGSAHNAVHAQLNTADGFALNCCQVGVVIDHAEFPPITFRLLGLSKVHFFNYVS